MKQLKKIWKKGILFLVVTSFLFMKGAVSANNSPPSSNVWLAVINNALDIDGRVSITVPLAYGFVVNGTRHQENSQVSISVDNNALLLPNYTVNVLPSITGDKPDNHRPYSLTVGGDPTPFQMKNYSTCMDTDTERNPSKNPNIRVGLPVELDPYIENIEKDVNDKEHYWEAVEYKPSSQPGEDFKKYQISFCTTRFDQNGIETEKEHTFSATFKEWKNAIFLGDGQKIKLDAPILENGKVSESKLALEPSILSMSMDVQVGGTRGDYKQVEQSVKAGRINWIVIFKDPNPKPASPSP